MNSQLQQNATTYASSVGIELNLTEPLGQGTDGGVWRSNRRTAVKALERHRNYEIELECYRRFEEHGVNDILGFAVPELVGFDDELQIVEMRIVSPPFLIDFAKSWLDKSPDFSAEQLEYWHNEGQELFDEKWSDVLGVIWALKQYGIYYYDAKPGNIRFANRT